MPISTTTYQKKLKLLPDNFVLTPERQINALYRQALGKVRGYRCLQINWLFLRYHIFHLPIWSINGDGKSSMEA
jgi:hypothetical protein